MSDPKFTSGPWRWELNEKSHQVRLAGGKSTEGFGHFDLTVIDFVRYGMRSAAPRFAIGRPSGGIMHRVEQFGIIQSGREHHSHWFKLVKHPDAHLIAASPAMYAEIESNNTTLKILIASLSESSLRCQLECQVASNDRLLAQARGEAQ